MHNFTADDKVIHSDTGETLIFVMTGSHMGVPSAFCKGTEDEKPKAYDPRKLTKLKA